MRTYISDMYELNKLLRTELITQTGLPNDHVLNGLSVRGAELEKRLAAQKLEPFSLTDNFVVFELSARNSTSNVTQTIGNDLYVVSSYSFKLIIYGLSSMQLAQIIRSRFESEEVRQKLFKVGIYIEGISNSGSINEFINSTMWIRTDISIEVSCESKIEKVTDAQETDSLGDMLIKTIPSRETPPIGEYGKFSGYVTEAIVENPIEGVKVEIWRYAEIGDQLVCETYTDENGYYESCLLPYAEYFVRFIWSEGEDDSLSVYLNTNYLPNQNIILERHPSSELQIVMTFGNDEYFYEMDYEAVLKTSNGYYVGPGQFEDDDGNIKLEKLYNPPSHHQYYYGSNISVNVVKNETEYIYYIESYDEGNPENFQTSLAVVNIYINNQLIRSLEAPSGIGKYWNVLTYDKINGLIIIDEITNTEPSIGS